MTTIAVFEAAVRENRGKLLRRARFVTMSSSIEAEDLVQEALMRAWHYWTQVADRVTNVTRWLFNVLHWTWCEMVDKLARRPTSPLTEKMLESLTAEQPDTLMLIDLERALDAMPTIQSSRLRELAETGDTYREIGERRGMTGQAVYFQVQQGRRFLDRRGLNARNISS